MDGDGHREKLAAFLPRIAWGLLRENSSHVRLDGCAVFADVAGFTPLAESLSMIGKEGSEELTRIVNAFFSTMVGIVHEEGGDVLRFGGDAMTIFFAAGLRPALLASARMQEAAGRFSAIATRGGEFSLAMKVGLATGPILAGILGDAQAGSDYFAAGGVLNEAAEAEHHAAKGEILLSPACAGQASALGARIRTNADGYGLLESLPEGLAPAIGAGPGLKAPAMPAEPVLRAFLPSFIVDKAGVPEGFQSGEHRRTTVLFLALEGLDYEADAGVRDKVGTVYREVASVVRSFGGTVNKFDMGDKGSKAICIFGAPVALDGQEEMACRASLALLENKVLHSLLTGIRGGITSSSLFSAYVGGEERREYTVMGDGINLAARLMSNAKSWRMLASEEVAREAGGALEFRPLDPIFVKGKKEKVPIYRPLGERVEGADDKVSFVGRGEALDVLLSILSSADASGLAFVQGEPGVGKSALLHEAGLRLNRRGIRHVTVPLLSHEVGVYLGAWGAVLLSRLGITRRDPAELRAEALRGAVSREDAEYLPLVAPLLGLEMAETDSTAGLQAKDRKDLTFAILARLLLSQVTDVPYGVFIDPVEHADPASLEFLHYLLTEAGDRPLKVLLASRQPPSDDLIKAQLELRVVALDVLGRPEVEAFLVRSAGMAPPTEPFLDFLVRKTHGNPRFLTQLLVTLQKAGVVSPGPSGLLEADEDRLSSAAFPDTLEGLLLARVDALPEEEKRILKAASVLGESFSVYLLGGLLGREPKSLVPTVQRLAERGLVRMDAWGDRFYATFNDSLMRDAVYEALNFSTKRVYHGSVARLIEARESARPEARPILGYHYQAAGEDGKAAAYTWRAARDARARYDNLVAYDLFSRYVVLKERSGASLEEDQELVQAQLFLAEAANALGRLDEADAISERIVDCPGPPSEEKVVSLMRLADNQRRRGNLESSLDMYRQASAVAGDHGFDRHRMQILCDSAVPVAMLGRLDEAREQFARAAVLARRMKAFSSLLHALMNHGLCLYHAGDRRDEAIRILSRARRIAAGRKLKSNLIQISVNLSQCLFDAGNYGRALATTENAIPAARQFGNRGTLLSLSSNKALYESMLGRWDKAAGDCEWALAHSRHYGMPYLQAVNLQTKAVLEGVKGAYDAAMSDFAASLDLYIRQGFSGQALASLSDFLALCNALSLTGHAENVLSRVLPALGKTLTNEEAAWAVGFNGQWLVHRCRNGGPDRGAAGRKLRQLLASAQNADVPWLMAEVGEAALLLDAEARIQGHPDVPGWLSSISAKLAKHFCPPKVGPYWLSLAENGLRRKSVPVLKEAMAQVRRYAPYFDRGLLGIRYYHLNGIWLAQKKRKKEARASFEKAKFIVTGIQEGITDEAIERAFLSLRAVKRVMASSAELD